MLSLLSLVSMFWECRLSMIHLKYAHVGFTAFVSAIVGAAQCAVAGHGLFVLHRYYKRSAEQHKKNMEAIE